MYVPLREQYLQGAPFHHGVQNSLTADVENDILSSWFFLSQFIEA